MTDFEETEVVRLRRDDGAEDEGDESVWWVASLLGAALTAGAVFVLYETLAIFSESTTAWAECLRSESGALLACRNEVTLSYEYRYGIDALTAMGTAIAAAFIGPIPVIATLNRYKNNVVAGILFMLVMIPYGALAFLILVIGLLIATFYLLQF